MEASGNTGTDSIFSIQQKRSSIGTTRKVRTILKSLGLRRMHHTVQRPDTAQVRGLIDKVKHLIEVTRL